jgi:hypothetical protein
VYVLLASLFLGCALCGGGLGNDASRFILYLLAQARNAPLVLCCRAQPTALVVIV